MSGERKQWKYLPARHVETLDATIATLAADLAAERALADQLADAILSASVEEAIEKTDTALAAYAAARTNGSASATDVGGPS